MQHFLGYLSSLSVPHSFSSSTNWCSSGCNTEQAYLGRFKTRIHGSGIPWGAIYINYLSISVAKIKDANNSMKENVFWLMVSEGSAHGFSPKQLGRVSPWSTRKQSESRSSWEHDASGVRFGDGAPSVTYLLQAGPPLALPDSLQLVLSFMNPTHQCVYKDPEDLRLISLKL